MTYQFGDVVLVRFPFTDQSTTKQRPGVIVSSAAYNRVRRDLVLMAITSQVRGSGSYVIPADAHIFRRWAQLTHGKPDHHLEDALIAATALVRGLSVVTRNVNDFRPFGISLINPFTKRPAQS